MVAIAKGISLILDLEEGDISSIFLQNLGNAGKLLAFALPNINNEKSIYSTRNRGKIQRPAKKVGHNGRTIRQGIVQTTQTHKISG